MLITAELLDRNFERVNNDEFSDEPYWSRRGGNNDIVNLYTSEDEWLLTIEGTFAFRKGYLELYIKYVDELQQALDLFKVGMKVGEIFIY